MGARGGGGSRGGRAGGGFSQASFDKATDKLYSAISSGNKSAISKATASVKSQVSKMPAEQVKAYAKSASSAAYFSRKDMGPKSEYNATAHKYNVAMSRIYNSVANN